jgi:serine/threonine-protein kinase
MGEVYAGVDDTLKRRVALKAIRADDRLNAHSKARFLREAQILSQLDHPHICRVYNYVEGAGHDWLVLELIEGQTLHGAIQDGLGAAERMTVAQQIAEVLVVTHAAGVVHRDLKPGNVMVTAAGGVKVLDFGLARSLPAGGAATDGALDDGAGAGDGRRVGEIAAAAAAAETAPDETRLPEPGELPTIARSPSHAGPETEDGALLGTLAYMSPEQARGEPATPASDLYSFGLLLQELYTGRPPYPETGDAAALLDHARRGSVPPPAGLDADLTRLIQRLKAPAPAERPTAIDTLDRLRWIAAKPRRRARRLVVAAAVTLAALGAAKYFVDLRAERTVAVEARRDAEGRRKQAEDLIGFMLGDLRKKLEQVGRLEILDEVGAKAMDYFAAVPESSLSDEELAQRSAALYQIGDVRITQGRLAEAAKPLAQSLALARTLAARHPDDGQRLFDLAQSHFWVGFVNWRQRRLDDALVHFREYLRIAERLVAIDAANIDWQIELASANSNIGSVLEEQGDLDGALERFHAALDIERGLLAKRPDDHTLRRNVAASNNAVGAVLRATGDLADSLAHHRAELALQEELVRLEPGTAGWRQYLGVSNSRVAMLLEALGQLPDAATHAERALAIAAGLAASDPENVDWRRELGRSHYRAGTIAGAAGRRADARSHLQQALAFLARAAEVDPRNPARQRDLAEVHAARAQHYLLEGDVPRAVAAAAAVQEIADRLITKSADDGQAVRLRGVALSLQGHAWARAGDGSKARVAWVRAASTLEAPARASRDYQVLDPWARTLIGLGRLDEAKEVVKALGAAGYRHPLFVEAITRGGLGMPPSSPAVPGVPRT